MGTQVSYGRLSKELMCQELKSLFDKNEDFFVAQGEKLSVDEVGILKSSLRQATARYCVVKNSLCHRILREKSLTEVIDLVQGQTAIIFSSKDSTSVARVLIQFAKGHGTFTIRGGLYQGQRLDSNTVQTLAVLPPREVLLGKLAGGMKSPIVGLVFTLSGVLRQLVMMLDHIREKKEK